MGATGSVYYDSEGFNPSTPVSTHVDMMTHSSLQSSGSMVVSKLGKFPHSSSVPPLSNRSPGDNKRGGGMNTKRSLCLHAVLHHSRQRNAYISSSTIMKFTPAEGVTNAESILSSSVGYNTSPGADSSATGLCLESTSEAEACTVPAQSLGKKLNLRLQIKDEDDWIQVTILPPYTHYIYIIRKSLYMYIIIFAMGATEGHIVCVVSL